MMMIPVSVVIITKNEAEVIAQCIKAARRFTDDIVVVDNGSTDHTMQIAHSLGCRVFERHWSGYGANKNKGIALARYDWVLSLDADEVTDNNLIEALQQLNYKDSTAVYDIRFKTYFGKKLVRFGSWGRDHHIRLFNRQHVRWSELQVHETLLLPGNAVKKKLDGCIHHYSVDGLTEYKQKALLYARLCAQKYHQAGKKSSFIKRWLSPSFNFIKNYVFYLGFADGKEGWYIATNTARHTWLKYHLLQKMGAVGINKTDYYPESLSLEY
ncbi:(heptosyl)LPS beta-1,4-glucosyltransferase [Mucilaginibacter yixingensis]|uniref:(Heptosyl)LPS beta-1,4-glucosyltransferase n=1 Tax=Mucilaginibacter yixingensis TaxID=1295612 RepID=A0A2T5J7L7_9SPHI|nr:glycosyltransferase family 2 protein [Mucilaginibacter yixingensis]PTQ95133.1 (heptosyl)LPS beta-1,4-glucosyltransferase [Mucilaginibacter yixingensis]